MTNLEGLGRILLIAGGLIFLLGLVLLLLGRFPYIGKLPGDILIKRDNFTFYFPIVTFLLLSVMLTLLLNILLRFLGR
jgi:uncharacterized protein HemY